jgi:cytochrome P450 PksS
MEKPSSGVQTIMTIDSTRRAALLRPEQGTVVPETMNPNLASPEFKADPYPFYAYLRAHAPVFPVTLPDRQTAWLVTRYDDAVTVLKDERFANDRSNAQTPEQLAKLPWVPPVFRPLTRNMLSLDGADHARLRGLVHQAFTPRRVEQLRERIERLTNELLDAVQRRGRMDVIEDYALPLPTTIIAEMLGVPGTDRKKFNRWSNSLVTVTSSRWGTFLSIPSVWALMRYARNLIRARRAAPQDDLATALVQAEEAGDHLNEDELVAMIVLLLVAGHETTVNLIGNGLLTLLDHPAELARLRDDPALIRPAVEELLRFQSPVEMANDRFAREDIELAGVTIPRGALVHAVIASANRDEQQFPDPDCLDITREPNRHLAFGQGVHYCLGAPLARMEGQIAIANLLRRTPNLRLAVARDAVRWRKGMLLRGLRALPVAFGAVSH